MVKLEIVDIDRKVEIPWEVRTPFEAIELQFGLKNKDVIKLMRREMNPSSVRMWRARTQGRSTKHGSMRAGDVNRFRCSRQSRISSKMR